MSLLYGETRMNVEKAMNLRKANETCGTCCHRGRYETGGSSVMVCTLPGFGWIPVQADTVCDYWKKEKEE